MRGKILATLRAKPVAIWFSEKKAISPRSNGRGHGCLSHFISSLFAIALLVAPAAQARELDFRGQKIAVEGVDDGNWLYVGTPNSGTEELILVYTNTAAPGTLTLPVGFEAQMLLVGGGGAGGFGTTGGTNPGGGGGGGEVKTLASTGYDAGTYTITVGKGGAQTTAQSNGENGYPSFLTFGAAELARALGGGGGGAKGDGNGTNIVGMIVATGGGGGGQIKTGVYGQGGLGIFFNGGKATANNRSGGGGGAGGPGDSSTGVKGGDGGVGASSTIWADVGETELAAIPRRYGGGGGGGQSAGADAAGAGVATDGGGNGGRQNHHGENGTACTGGGGGGGGRASSGKNGGAGGSGIVIIRITYIVKTMVWKPIDVRGFGGGKTGTIFVDENATVSTVGSDVVIVYSNTVERGGLSFKVTDDMTPEQKEQYKNNPPIWALARVLAVGGGGGGGLITAHNYGAGGGGGAGGVVTAKDIIFDTNDVYSVVVGAGGAGGAVNEAPGESGKSSTLKKGNDFVVPEAVGGGGGGAHSAGLPGGSGGGGSRTGSQQDGGAGTPGQGYAGGTCFLDSAFVGAGGGGAGGPGKDVDRSAQGVSGGAGGAGVTNDITGAWTWYAGGGGGAYNGASINRFLGGAGGSGIGGDGAGLWDNVDRAATSGRDGTGSGGGGGASHEDAAEVAGNGGSGIVIIRLSGFVVDAVPVPKTRDYTYDAAGHRGVEEFYVYDLTGTPVATNSDVYVVTATLKPEYPAITWGDAGGGRNPRTVYWKIRQMEVKVPEALTGFVYSEMNGVAVKKVAVKSVDASKVNGGVDPDGNCWTNTSAGVSVRFCSLAGYVEENAGTYTFTASLWTDGGTTTNFIWTMPRTTTDRQVGWMIAQATNAITRLTLDDWQYGVPVDDQPSAASTFTNRTDRYAFTYCKGDREPRNPDDYDLDEKPTEPGIYWVRAYLPKDSEHTEPHQFGNWGECSKTKRFCIWRHPTDVLQDYVDVLIDGYSGGATSLSDFPVLVRLREPTCDASGAVTGGLPGFTYRNAGRDGSELRFLSLPADDDYKADEATRDRTKDVLLPFEVEEWDMAGESRIWVKVPKVVDKTTRFRMYWHRRPESTVTPDLLPRDTWSDYAGVWHLSKPDDGGTFADSSGNGLVAVVDSGAKVTPVDGKSGQGVYVEGGNITVPGYNALNNTTDFMFSGFYRNDKKTASNFNFAGTKAGKGWNFSPGWSFFMNSATKVGASAAGSWDNGVEFSDIATVFHHLAYVVPKGNSNRYSYHDGASQKSITGSIITNALPLQLLGTKFSCDEVRLRKSAPSTTASVNATWAKAEYESVNNASFCKFGLVNQLQGDDTRAWVNFWSASPWAGAASAQDPTGRYWATNELTGAIVEGNSGALAKVYGKTTYEGTPSVACFKMPGREPAAVDDLLEKGAYQLVFGMTNPDDGTTDFPRKHVIFEGARTVNVEVVGDAPRPIDPTGAGTNLRVLLANDDFAGREAGNAVSNQWYDAWSHANLNPPPAAFTNDAGTAVITNCLLAGTRHTLTNVAGRALWQANEAYLGSLFSSDPDRADRLLPQQHALPYSATGEQVGQLTLRNLRGAEIVSPWYTNGIGTIYFDAVNGYETNAAAFQLAVEVSTDEVEDVADAVWTPLDTLISLKYDGSAFAAPTTNGVVELDVAGGGGFDRFCRVIAPVGSHEPMRFRIVRRTSLADDAGTELDPDDWRGYLVVDNVIASWPTESAHLTSRGRYDPTKAGLAVDGMEKALSVDYPTVADTGNLFVSALYSGGVKLADIASARCYYRWRYLNSRHQPSEITCGGRPVPVFDVVYLDPGNGFTSQEAFKLPPYPGDIEYYFDLTAVIPYYGYVDYSGCAIEKPTGGYTEDPAKGVVCRFSGEANYPGGTLPSMGTDWFVRIREGESVHSAAKLTICEGALAGEYPMHLTTNHIWQCQVAVPTNAVGTCKFYFSFCTLTPDGDGWTPEWEDRSAAEDVAVLPTNGTLQPGAVARAFTIDHAATHLQFTVNDSYGSYGISRSLYQQFNDWNDAHTAEHAGVAEFKVNSVLTNGVNAVDMKRYEAPVTNWTPYVSEDANWNETFYLANYNDPGYPKETVFPSHVTPNYWEGTEITFVSELLGGPLEKSGSEYLPTPKNSGMAGKLLGQGMGQLLFSPTKFEPPDGLERITFKARIGQSVEFDAFNYSWPAARETNYMFTALATMSHLVADNNKEGDMAAGASLSMVAYYQERRGCYELRVERIETGKRVMMSIWKWHLVRGAMTATCLVRRRMDDGSMLWTNEPNDAQGKCDPSYRLMFLSAETTADGTVLYGGLSLDAKKPTVSFNKLGTGYYGVYYKDTSADRLKFGSYGVGAKDCPGEFLRPAHREEPVQNITLVAKNKSDYEFTFGRSDDNARYFRTADNKSKDIGADWSELVDDVEDIKGDYLGSLWVLTPDRIEYFANDYEKSESYAMLHQGLRVPLYLAQTLNVELAEKDDVSANRWKRVGEADVSGYGFTSYDLPLYRKGKYDVRFTTGDQAIDVVVDDIRQAQWMGHDVEGRLDDVTQFIYTKGHVVTNAAAQRKELELVPARAMTTKALSLRSPVLRGLGKFTFAYANADEHAELWVQMATNHVDGNLGDYNDSVRSVEKGGQQAIGEWVTVAKYTYENDDPGLALGVSGVKTVYLGLHDQANAPVEGIFRLFVPTNVVAATDAMTSQELDAGGKDYGKVTILGASCSDEPGLDNRSWRGWNMRTAGDDRDTERRMFLADGPDDSANGFGLVCALNNSVNDVAGDDAEKAKSQGPAIWTPTLGMATNAAGEFAQTGVGEISFRARLYGDTLGIAPGKVTVWGASDSVLGKWRKVAEFEISEPYFQSYSCKIGGSYAALRLEISEPSARTTVPTTDRVILDEVSVCESAQPTLGIAYARAFRDGLGGEGPIVDCDNPSQQPLCGENWGVQTKLTLQQMEDEVDPASIRVFVSWFDGAATKENWGYGSWGERASGEIELKAVGTGDELIYRSVSAEPNSVMPPSPDAGTVVQFMVRVEYANRAGTAYDPVFMKTWQRPSWYHPVDYNRSLGGGTPDGFAAYTILDSISPGRAWINEVNWNNGSKSVTHTDAKVVNNQFIEVCVPSGADMTGWKIRATNLNLEQWQMATFGSMKVNASKVTSRMVNGYEFFLLVSPETQLNGNIRDPDGNIDGIWNGDSISTVTSGSLSYANPYQFELIRPSGIIEHAFTIDGTNEWGTARYDATNLLARLNEVDSSPNRFYAGRELEKNDNGADPATRGTTFGSSGVTGGTAAGAPAPGAEGTWEHGLDFTAGSLNQGQVIPEGWLLAPNGTNAWVYFTVVGEHLHQKVGESTGRTAFVILPQGQSTNVVYTADPWYETATIAVDGVTNAVHKAGQWTYSFTVPEGSGTKINVVATEGADWRLDDDKFGIRDSRYRNAVLNWLQQWPDKTPDDIRFARHACLKTYPATALMTLIEMYWLDIKPFNSDDSTFVPAEGMDPLSGEQVFRYGFTDYAPNAVIRDKFGIKVTNSVFKVKMMITNEFDNTAYAPETLQGVGNERSVDNNYSGGWTGVTFKLCGFLDVNRGGGFNKGFLPFREFTFDANSFNRERGAVGTPTADNHPGTPGEFETVIELLDPFCRASAAGATYGWWRHPNTTPAFFTWKINHTNNAPITIERLKARDVYGE